MNHEPEYQDRLERLIDFELKQLPQPQAPESLLERVMAATGIESKTRAVDMALREMDRRAELKRLTSEGLGLSPDELKELYDPASERPEPIVSAKPVDYGRKPRSRR